MGAARTTRTASERHCTVHIMDSKAGPWGLSHMDWLVSYHLFITTSRTVYCLYSSSDPLGSTARQRRCGYDRPC